MTLSYQAGSLTSGTGSSMPGLRALMAHLLSRFPGAKSGGIGRAGSPSWSNPHSLHYEGRAADVMVDKVPESQRVALGSAMVNWLVANADALGIQAITFNGWHWGYGGKWYWRKSKVGPRDHWNHVHVEMNKQAAAMATLPQAVINTPTQVRNTYPGSQGAPPEGTFTPDWVGNSNVAVSPASDSGGTTMSGTGDTAATTKPQTPQEIEAFIRNEYGYLATYLSDPELGPILKQAASLGYSKDRLYGMLTGTQWWAKHSDAQRKWEAIEREDPATAARMRDERRAIVHNEVARIGLTLSPEQVEQVVNWSLQTDESMAQITDHLITAFQPTGNFDAGELGEAQMSIQQLEDDYMVDIPAAKMREWAMMIVGGEKDLEGIRPLVENMSRQTYANNKTLLASLDVGGTISDAVSSQRDRIAELMEISPDLVDFRQPKWSKVLNMADETGTFRPMTDSEASVYAKRQDEWAGTDNARKTAAEAGRSLAKVLGFAQ